MENNERIHSIGKRATRFACGTVAEMGVLNDCLATGERIHRKGKFLILPRNRFAYEISSSFRLPIFLFRGQRRVNLKEKGKRVIPLYSYLTFLLALWIMYPTHQCLPIMSQVVFWMGLLSAVGHLVCWIGLWMTRPSKGKLEELYRELQKDQQ